MFCNSCGDNLPDSAKFCGTCGIKQEIDGTSTSKPAPLPQNMGKRRRLLWGLGTGIGLLVAYNIFSGNNIGNDIILSSSAKRLVRIDCEKKSRSEVRGLSNPAAGIRELHTEWWECKAANISGRNIESLGIYIYRGGGDMVRADPVNIIPPIDAGKEIGFKLPIRQLYNGKDEYGKYTSANPKYVIGALQYPKEMEEEKAIEVEIKSLIKQREQRCGEPNPSNPMIHTRCYLSVHENLKKDAEYRALSKRKDSISESKFSRNIPVSQIP